MLYALRTFDISACTSKVLNLWPKLEFLKHIMDMQNEAEMGLMSMHEMGLIQKVDMGVTECPVCEGRGCDHCEGQGYHVSFERVRPDANEVLWVSSTMQWWYTLVLIRNQLLHEPD